MLVFGEIILWSRLEVLLLIYRLLLSFFIGKMWTGLQLCHVLMITEIQGQPLAKCHYDEPVLGNDIFINTNLHRGW